jgi:hypothetical protein
MNEWVKSTWDKVKVNTLFLSVTIIGFLTLLKLGVGFIGVLLFFWLAHLVKYMVLGKDFDYFFVKGLVVVFLLVSIIWFVPGLIGWAWFLLLIFGYVVYRVWLGRDVLVDGMRQIEIILFGKSLDKDNWTRGDVPSFKNKEYEEGEDDD